MDLKPINLDELNPRLNVKVLTDQRDLEILPTFFRENKVLGLDCEFTVTDRYTTRQVRTIQFGTRDQQFVLDMLYLPKDAVRSVIQDFIENPAWTKVGHALDAEYVTIKHSLGLRLCGLWDTLLAEKLLFAGLDPFTQKGRWGLDDVVARRFGYLLSKDEQTLFNMSDPLTEKQAVYCALDVRFPLAIRNQQIKEVQQDEMTVIADIEMRALPGFADMHMNGMLCSREPWLALLNRNQERLNQVVAAMDIKFIPVVGEKVDPSDILREIASVDQVLQVAAERLTDEIRVREELWRAEKDKSKRAEYRAAMLDAKKERDFVLKSDGKLIRDLTAKAKRVGKENEAYEGRARINYGSTQQLKEGLKQLGYKLPDTNDATLFKHALNPKLDAEAAFSSETPLEEHGIIDLIRLHRELRKRISQYGLTWITPQPDGLVNPETGRIHSRYNQIGAETGRTSSVSPNMQNLPGAKEVRSCFVARPGHKLITIDMSGAELRIMAEMSGDPVWCAAFQNGWDVHSIGAELLCPEEWAAATEDGCKFASSKLQCKCKGHQKLRKTVKAYNFGLAYGKTEYGFAADLGISVQEAGDSLRQYKAKFPVVFAFLEKLGQTVKTTCKARTIAGRLRKWRRPEYDVVKADLVKKHLEVGLPTPSNYEVFRELSKRCASMEREGKNSPIQGSNVDIIKLAIANIWPDLEPVYGALLLAMVHDELVIDVPETQAEVVCELVAKAIREAAAVFMKRVTMESEWHVEEAWTK